jgi:hypothetical protein
VGGYRIGSSFVNHPFLWSPVDGKVDIPVTDGEAMAINDKGMVVGVRGGPAVTPTIWVWTAVDGVRDVDTITDSNSYVAWLRINDLGDIVGARTLSDNTSVATVWRHP